VVDWQRLLDRVEEKTHILYVFHRDSAVATCNVKEVLFSFKVANCISVNVENCLRAGSSYPGYKTVRNTQRFIVGVRILLRVFLEQ
jgi:hypothetical protein